MRSTLIAGMTAAAGMLMSMPLWAGGDHGHGHWKHRFDGHHHVYRHHIHRHVVVRERWYSTPVYAAAAAPLYAAPVAAPVYAMPAPGVSIVLPGIFVALR